jgi:hypothetical protein
VPTFSIRSLKINELDCSVCPYCERQASVARFFSFRRNATSITHSLRSVIRFRHSTQIVPAIPPRSVSMWTHATRPFGLKTADHAVATSVESLCVCKTAGTLLETRRWPVDAS